MIHRLLLSIVALAALTTAARADMVFVKIQGQTQGTLSDWHNPIASIDGVSLTDHGRVEDFAWGVISPRDAASGLPTGKRMHRPVTVRLLRSGATLLIANALTNNENLPEVSLKWFGPDPDGSGTDVLRQETILRDANVSSFSMYTVREAGEMVTYVDVSFTYRAIGIADFHHGISYEDDWESPVN